MVCKEDVLLWFKDLEGYKRIDIMFELLNMCVPFELRFLGSCIEEIGKHSYQELRGSAIIANDVDKLTKDNTLSQGLLDEGVRHRVLIYLSLLSSSNCQCANWLYKTLLRTEWVESCVSRGNCKDDNLQNELLLLFTMGLHHPAFTFDQKHFFGNMLAQMLEQRECKNHIMSKPFPNFLPGFGFNNVQKIISTSDTSVPFKTPMMCHGEPVPSHQQPQGLVAAPIELMQMWGRPGFVGQLNSGPEIAPFPPPPASPIVSQPTTPSPSRATSPHRAYPLRPNTGLPPPNQMVEVLPPFTPSIPLDPLSQSNLSSFSSDFITNDEDFTQVPEEKLRDSPWLNPVMVRVDMKPPNGMRLPSSCARVPDNYFLDQVQALNLEAENSLHCSSSSSSSNNSLNQSPPDTPTTVPSVPHHGPGRGDNKSRMNGVPQYVNTGPPNINVGPPVCDTTPPPHSAPALSNCSVPYTNYPPQVTLTAIPNRSVFQYTQHYRPPFSTPFNYHPPEIYSYSCPYVPVVFSSAPSQIPQRNSNCFNCGAVGHGGADCNGQTIEDITQKKVYTLDYNSPLRDTDK